MFDSLADRIKADENREVNKTERYVRYAAVAVLSVLLFGGLYFGLRLVH